MRKLIDVDRNGDMLFEENGNYYIQYDAGRFTVAKKNLQISKQEAFDILNSNNPIEAANSIIISYHNRRIYGEDAEPFNN